MKIALADMAKLQFVERIRAEADAERVQHRIGFGIGLLDDRERPVAQSLRIDRPFVGSCSQAGKLAIAARSQDKNARSIFTFLKT